MVFISSVVGIATRYGLDDRGVGVRVLVVSRIFSSPNHLLNSSVSFLHPSEFVLHPLTSIKYIVIECIFQNRYSQICSQNY
jgi:hypothetical protein